MHYTHTHLYDLNQWVELRGPWTLEILGKKIHAIWEILQFFTHDCHKQKWLYIEALFFYFPTTWIQNLKIVILSTFHFIGSKLTHRALIKLCASIPGLSKSIGQEGILPSLLGPLATQANHLWLIGPTTSCSTCSTWSLFMDPQTSIHYLPLFVLEFYFFAQKLRSVLCRVQTIEVNSYFIRWVLTLKQLCEI